MKIEEVFHDRWAAVSALNALLPASRVYTGRVPANPTVPYASITLDGFTTLDRSNLSWFREIRVKVRIIPNDYPSGRAIHDAVLDGFEDQSLSATDGAVEKIEHDQTDFEEGQLPDEPDWQIDIFLAALCREDRP